MSALTVGTILARAREGRDVSAEEAELLFAATGDELAELFATADALRREQVGETVAYVVNRNINFTNACVKACRFCAFSRGHRSEEAYFLDEAEIVRRAREAWELGATEVCIQAGLPKDADGRIYVKLCRAVKTALPDIHVHAFSPEEVKYGAGLCGISFRDYLAELKDAGIGSLPGTSAEILDDAVRDRISPGRITTREWIEVVSTAHSLGIPTTSTIMFGHVETLAQRARHFCTLRELQRETHGITEIVPLSFVSQEAPMVRKGLVPGLSHGPSTDDVRKTYAVARLVLGRDIPNLQASWVKEGLPLATSLLDAGVNDLGGTLMNESISISAGADHGERMTPSALRAAIRKAGRVPVQRDTLYQPLRVFGREEAEGEAHPLDAVADADQRFGSYRTLTKDARFRLASSRAR